MQLNFLLIHGLEEKKDEGTDDLVLHTINAELETELQIKDIDPTHGIGKYKKDNSEKT